LNARAIVAQAWEITRREPQLRRWGFASAFFATLFNAKLLVYQVWFVYSYFWENKPIGFFEDFELLYQVVPGWVFWTIVTALIILVIIEWLFPHFAKGAIIGLVAKSYNGEEIKGGLVLAVYNFFPLLAVHELLVLSGLSTTITLISLALRYGGVAAPFAIAAIVLTWIATNVVEFFWVFSEEAIVINKMGLRAAISKSIKLVISYLSHIFFLLMLLIVIMLRIVANALMVILVPGVVIGLGYLLTSFLSPLLSYSIMGLVGIAIIYAASYLFAYLEVFREAVWTITYLELKKYKELDIIED